MKKDKLLYLTVNDGSDMRIVKEVKSLSSMFDITYLGVGKETEKSFAKQYCTDFKLINGKHKSLLTMIFYINKMVLAIFKHNFKSVHVINEQLYIFLFPFLIKKHIVLDIFDSIFLKMNQENEKMYLLKKIIYGIPSKIIVTDENRKSLLPEFSINKSIVIPNVPYLISYSKKTESNNILRICYFGTLAKNRGSKFVTHLLNRNNNIKIKCAGWISDQYTENLLKHPNVEYLGVMNQKETNTYISQYGDYMIAIYPTNNLNNINASPNKLYDSIHTKTPILINSEIKVSNFVSDNNIGLVLDLDKVDYSRLGKDLFIKKGSFQFNEKMINKYCWENYEDKLLSIHNT